MIICVHICIYIYTRCLFICGIHITAYRHKCMHVRWMVVYCSVMLCIYLSTYQLNNIAVKIRKYIHIRKYGLLLQVYICIGSYIYIYINRIYQ